MAIESTRGSSTGRVVFPREYTSWERIPAQRWYGRRDPAELTTEEFMELHCTGWIRPNAYEGYRTCEGLTWLGPRQKYPWRVGSLQASATSIEFRQTGELLEYVDVDQDGEVRRDERGLALMMSDEAIETAQVPQYDTKIVAFHGERPVGFVSNEWGAVGVWVAEPYQRRGIGTRLTRMHLHLRPRACLGQMTQAGRALAKAVHRSFLEGPGNLPSLAQRSTAVPGFDIFPADPVSGCER